MKVTPGLDVGDEEQRQAQERLAERLAGHDPTIWVEGSEAPTRLGWLDLPTSSRALLDELDGLRAWAIENDFDRVVLAGMGGSSLAPEVICAAAGREITILDTSDASQVAAALSPELAARTVVVVSSKSGSTVETDSHLRVALEVVGADRIVVVTDPGSPLEGRARELGVHEVVLADPEVGGRYSALTAFGLVPSALAGVDVAALLHDARDAGLEPGLTLGAALSAGLDAGLVHLLLPPTPHQPGVASWVEQLVAESTGKQGLGLLPVVVEADEPWPVTGTLQAVAHAPVEHCPTHVLHGSLGATFFTWEVAIAVVGWRLGIDPFDQPDVEVAKANARAFLDGTPPEPFTVTAQGELTALLRSALDAVPADGYLAVMAWLDRVGDEAAAGLRGLLQAATTAPVTFGWGPRFLHSTGQLHKGGPSTGSYLVVTADPPTDLPVPGRPFTFADLQRAQVAGDMKALTDHGRPVVHVHVRGRAGLQSLLDAAASL